MSTSALPDVIRCPAPECGWTMSTVGQARWDDKEVWLLRKRGWQVVNGAWTCQNHLPADRQAVPGAMGRARNRHCTTCGDTRGGPYGHEAYECTYQPSAIDHHRTVKRDGDWWSGQCSCGVHTARWHAEALTMDMLMLNCKYLEEDRRNGVVPWPESGTEAGR